MAAPSTGAGRRFAEWLPRGRPLDDETWEGRHRTVVWLLCAHIVGLATFGAIRGIGGWHLAAEMGAIAGLALVAAVVRTRHAQAAVGTLGLITCSAVLVHFSGGVIEAHFHFFIMVAVVTLYQSWIPFGLALLYVVVHHGTVGVLDSDSVYNHDAAINNPWLWAVIHGLFVLGAALAGLRSWKQAEIERERAEAAAVRLNERTVRHHEAVRLNDTVVQGLVAAKYATQLGEAEHAERVLNQTLLLAQELVSDLMAVDSDLFEPGGLRRVAAHRLTSP